MVTTRLSVNIWLVVLRKSLGIFCCCCCCYFDIDRNRTIAIYPPGSLIPPFVSRRSFCNFTMETDSTPNYARSHIHNFVRIANNYTQSNCHWTGITNLSRNLDLIPFLCVWISWNHRLSVDWQTKTDLEDWMSRESRRIFVVCNGNVASCDEKRNGVCDVLLKRNASRPTSTHV